MSVHADTDADVSCASYRYDPPILSVHASRLSLNVSVRERQEVTASAVAFASELAKAAAKCARIHAAQTHGVARAACDCANGQTVASTSAGEPA